jgi:transcriptional regulator with XRE-family HTH domain
VLRSRKGSGLEVDPHRVRRARLDAGLSLAKVAGEDVSRTFLLFVEQGKSRPSERVLKLIARRTGKPMKYFLISKRSRTRAHHSPKALAKQLAATAQTVRLLVSVYVLTESERTAMKQVEINLLQAVELTNSLVLTRRGERRPRKLRESY